MTSSDGNVHKAAPLTEGRCLACGETAEPQADNGLCDSCDARLANALRDFRGRATWGKPPGVCPICGWIGRLRAQEDWCPSCHTRWRKAGFPGDMPPPPQRAADRAAAELLDFGGRKMADLDKLTRLRVMWALARPDEENPYECPAPNCHETADPTRMHHCAMHENRLRRTGAYDGFECIQCGDDIKSLGGRRKLCGACKESWGYCGDSLHEGERLLPREDFNQGSAIQCKPCVNRRAQQKRRDRGLHGALGGLVQHYKLGEKPCPRCMGFLNSA